MAFPINWCQFWVDLPAQNTRFVHLFPAFLQWFSYDGTIDPATYDFNSLALGMLFWAQSSVSTISHGPIYMGDQQGRLRLFINTASGVTAYFPVFTIPYIKTDVLPSTHNITIRKFAGFSSRREVGHSYLPGVPRLWTNGTFLNSTGQTQANACAANFSNTVVSGGITFTPSLVSYSNGTIAPYVFINAQSRLALIKRRGRNKVPPPLYHEKPPPP